MGPKKGGTSIWNENKTWLKDAMKSWDMLSIRARSSMGESSQECVGWQRPGLPGQGGD